MRKTTISKAILVAIIGSLLFLGQACGKDSVEKSVTKVVQTIRAARRVTTEQHEYGRITDAQYVARLRLFRSVYVASDKLSDELVKFTEINSTNKVEVLRLLREFNAAVNELVQSGNVGVSDVKSKAEFARYSLLASGTLSAIEVVIASAKKPIPIEGAKFPKLGE